MADELRQTIDFVTKTLQDGLDRSSGTTWISLHIGRVRESITRLEALLPQEDTPDGNI